MATSRLVAICRARKTTPWPPRWISPSSSYPGIDGNWAIGEGSGTDAERAAEIICDRKRLLASISRMVAWQPGHSAAWSNAASLTLRPSAMDSSSWASGCDASSLGRGLSGVSAMTARTP
jgi:hypothetical protein